jgi:hypothetical protein
MKFVELIFRAQLYVLVVNALRTRVGGDRAADRALSDAAIRILDLLLQPLQVNRPSSKECVQLTLMVRIMNRYDDVVSKAFSIIGARSANSSSVAGWPEHWRRQGVR